MHTKKYVHLQSRIRKLGKIYLPHKLSPTGNYSDTVYEKVNAYLVLAHAEMEYYFEEIALTIAGRAFSKWDKEKRVSTPLLALVAYYNGDYPPIPDEHNGNRSDVDINARVQQAYTSFNQQIRASNHGIKEKNILNIFLPVGIKASEIEEDLLIALNNFGSERGRIAHSTRAVNTTSPEDAQNEMKNLMALLAKFDLFLCGYRNKI